MAKLRFRFPTFRQPPAVTHGRGSLRALAEEVPPTEAVFLVSGQEVVESALAEAYAKQGHDWTQARVWRKPAGEPTLDVVAAAAEWLCQTPVRRLVAVGGGSVLDGARLAWLWSAGELRFEEGHPRLAEPQSPRPELWLIPTTCATGAEGATVAVLSHTGRKWPVVTPRLLADRVVLDAQFLEGQPPAQLATSLGDALSHAIESYLSLVPGSLPRQSAVAALDLILTHFPAAESPSRLERLLEAGYLAGLAASHLSVGVVHAFAHSLAGFGAGHAEANAWGLLAGLELNREVPRLADLARRVGLADVDELQGRVAAIVDVALTPQARTRLADALARGRAELPARMAADACLRTNPRPLEAQDLDAFLTAVERRVRA